MQEIENNISNNEEIKVGKVVLVLTTEYSQIAGVLVMVSEYLVENGKQKIYRIRISDNSYIDVDENIIKSIKVMKINHRESLEEFQNTYGVECLDDTGSIKNISSIINEVLVKDIWAALPEDEKYELAENLILDELDTVDIINALDKSRKKNNELHKKVCELSDKKIKSCNAVIDFQKKYDVLSNMMPDYKWAFDFVYDYLGIGKLLREI